MNSYSQRLTENKCMDYNLKKKWVDNVYIIKGLRNCQLSLGSGDAHLYLQHLFIEAEAGGSL